MDGEEGIRAFREREGVLEDVQELAREDSRHVRLMFPLPSRLLICLPLLIFFLLDFIIHVNFGLRLLRLSYGLLYFILIAFRLNMLGFNFFFYHHKPIK